MLDQVIELLENLIKTYDQLFEMTADKWYMDEKEKVKQDIIEIKEMQKQELQNTYRSSSRLKQVSLFEEV